jgi:hypothetical protein
MIRKAPPFEFGPLDIRGHLDGLALTYCGGVVDVFPSFIGVLKARNAACAALVLLSETLGRAPA